MDGGKHPGLGTTVKPVLLLSLTHLPFQSIPCLLPPKPLAVSGTCQTLPGSLLCTFCSSTHSVTHPLPHSDKLLWAVGVSSRLPHVAVAPLPTHYTRHPSGRTGCFLFRALSAPSWVSEASSPPLACELQGPCLCALELNTGIPHS